MLSQYLFKWLKVRLRDGPAVITVTITVVNLQRLFCGFYLVFAAGAMAMALMIVLLRIAIASRWAMGVGKEAAVGKLAVQQVGSD